MVYVCVNEIQWEEGCKIPYLDLKVLPLDWMDRVAE
jgi:hypothetical protein